MRKVYIAVIISLALIMALLIASFAYLDRSKHRTYTYTVSMNGRVIGTIRVDKFITEDKLVYKSDAAMPFGPVFTEQRSRIDLDRKYNIESYSREASALRAVSAAYLENSKGLVSYLAKHGPGFTFADNMPVKKETFVFEEDSPVTYIPIMENYDFSKGRSQSFNTLTCPEMPGLPPVKRIVTFTSIKDEYIKTDSRKIKTENLIIKTRASPQAAVWVAKSDRAVIKIDIPARGITIMRSFRPRTVLAKELSLQDPRYLSKEAVFKGKNSELAGTMTIPTREGRFPAVLMLGGDAPADRNMQGLFAIMADDLSKNGFCTFRFDRRGIGLSKGDPASATGSEEQADAVAALEYLRSQDSVDPDRIAVVGHAKGAYRALRLASENDLIKGLALMAPAPGPERDAGKRPEWLKNAAAKYRWPEDYSDLVLRSILQTEAMVRNSNGDWAAILGKRCYLNAMREDMADTPAAVIGKVKIPVLILQGREDEYAAADAAGAMDASLAESGNTNHALKYYDRLGHLFGRISNDGVTRLYYETDRQVLEDVRTWLDKVFAEAVKPPPKSD